MFVFCLWVFVGICTVNISLDGHCFFFFCYHSCHSFFDFARAALAIFFSVSDFWSIDNVGQLYKVLNIDHFYVLVTWYVTWLCCCNFSNHSKATPLHFRLILDHLSFKSKPRSPGNVSISFDIWFNNLHIRICHLLRKQLVYLSLILAMWLHRFRFGAREVG